MPELHVAGAGSLIEFALRAEEFRAPVGRIQSLRMFPLSFREFLAATGKETLRDSLGRFSPGKSPDALLRAGLERELETYMRIGGMPLVVRAFSEGVSALDIQTLQTGLLRTFRQDFGKYASRARHKYLQEVFAAAPRMVGRRYKHAHVNPDIPNRDLRDALLNLAAAGPKEPRKTWRCGAPGPSSAG